MPLGPPPTGTGSSTSPVAIAIRVIAPPELSSPGGFPRRRLADPSHAAPLPTEDVQYGIPYFSRHTTRPLLASRRMTIPSSLANHTDPSPAASVPRIPPPMLFAIGENDMVSGS